MEHISPQTSHTAADTSRPADALLDDEMHPSSLGLDPSDPLNLLLNNYHTGASPPSGSASSDSDAASPPDWSELSAALWGSADGADLFSLGGSDSLKPNDVLAAHDFSFQFPMDLDACMAVEPSVLHLNAHGHGASPFAPTPTYIPAAVPHPHVPLGLFPSQTSFPFTAPAPLQYLGDRPGARRLSVTSSSSSSGASLSPVLDHAAPSAEHIPALVAAPNSADELAQRVRLAAGFAHAVPGDITFSVGESQYKLPIPRLRPATAVKSGPPSSASSRSNTSSPPPAGSDVSSSPASPSPVAPPAPAPATSSGRPKTDHTTIERRYRTNLNARIQSLKQAVPALRVLEKKPAGDENAGPELDVVDDRGFVDGVKVARKVSKANVLGKAVEYIRVLKKREARLLREQDGLKALVCSLGGERGPALLQLWEREWTAKFGGRETDEIEREEADVEDDDDEEGAAGGADADGADGDDDGEEGEDGRARKKLRVSKEKEKVKRERKKRAPPPPVMATVPGPDGGTAVPEKRKRGRPRKNPLPPVAAPAPAQGAMSVDGSVSASVSPQQQPAQQQLAAPPQYLLAAFAFFSFFNSPLTASFSPASSSAASAHSGVVLSHPTPLGAETLTPTSVYAWRDLVQVFHLLVSALVFLSVVLPWLPAALRRSSAGKLLGAPFALGALHHPRSARATKQASAVASATATGTSSASASSSDNENENDSEDAPTIRAAIAPSKATRGHARLQLAAALAGGPDSNEASRLYTALGVTPGAIGALAQGLSAVTGAGRRGGAKAGAVGQGAAGDFELRQLEQRAWVRIGELVACDGNASAAVRMQTYWSMRARISPFAASASDLATLALIVRPLAPPKARALWAEARQAQLVRPHERLVLASLSVEAAALQLAAHRSISVNSRVDEAIAIGAGRGRLASPVGILAATLVRDRVRRHAAVLFVRTVLRPRDDDGEDEAEACPLDAAAEQREDTEVRETLGAGSALGGHVGALADRLARVCGSSIDHGEDGDTDDDDEADEVNAVLRALVLYRRTFPSCLVFSASSSAVQPSVVVSPPSSSAHRRAARVFALRKALGSTAFDYDGAADEADEKLRAALEDARDRAVDILTSPSQF